MTSVERHGLTSFSDFAIGATATKVLPLELLSFSSEENGKANTLVWLVASEENMSHYEVERGNNGEPSTTIGIVNARGNINEEWTYTFNDERPEWISYYRLKMVDLDGNYEYSNTIIIKRETGKSIHVSSVFPIPTQDRVNIELVSTIDVIATFEIVDVLGRILYTEQNIISPGINNKTFNVGHLSSGNYFIRIIGEEESVFRFVVLEK